MFWLNWPKKQWNKNSEKILHKLLIVAIISSTTDILTTLVAMGVWPQFSVEQIPSLALAIGSLGLIPAMGFFLFVRYTFATLLFHSNLIRRSRLLGLGLLSLGGVYCTIYNLHSICMLLWYNV